MRCALGRSGRLSRRRSGAARRRRGAHRCARFRSPSCARSTSAAASASRSSTRSSRSSGPAARQRRAQVGAALAGARSPTTGSPRRSRDLRAPSRRATSARWSRRSIRSCSALSPARAGVATGPPLRADQARPLRARRGRRRSCARRRCTPRRVLVDAVPSRGWHARGLRVHVWTVDDPAELRCLAALGVDGVITNRPKICALRVTVLTMSERDDRGRGGFTEETNATPLVRLTGDVQGPKRPCLVVIAGAQLGEIFPIEGEIIIGRDPEAALRLADDEGVSRRHAQVSRGRRRRAARRPRLAERHLRRRRAGRRSACSRRAPRSASARRRCSSSRATTRSRRAAQRQLLESALRDGLTHAFNRRYFVSGSAPRSASPSATRSRWRCCMLDIDHFKQLNDKHGHLVGDDVLARRRRRARRHAARRGRAGALRRRGVRRCSCAASTQENARVLGERLRARSSRLGLTKETAREALPVTVSVGIAIFPVGERRGDVPRSRSGQAAHRARRRGALSCQEAGRNRVER